MRFITAKVKIPCSLRWYGVAILKPTVAMHLHYYKAIVMHLLSTSSDDNHSNYSSTDRMTSSVECTSKSLYCTS